MPKLLKHIVIEEILKVGLIPVFHHDRIEVAKSVAKACFEGGAKVVEFTNRGDLAYTVFNELSRWCVLELPEAILGAGTIVDPATAALFINAGANFIVGPLFNPEVARICNRHRVLYIPGCQTPTEIFQAQEMGSDIVKLFPASVLTPGFIKAVLGPSPHTLLMASGGVKVDREDIMEWIRMGAAALNIGSDLIRRDLIEECDFMGIRENVEFCIGWIEQARKQRVS